MLMSNISLRSQAISPAVAKLQLSTLKGHGDSRVWSILMTAFTSEDIVENV